MSEALLEKARRVMEERFGGDALIALATVEGGVPFVREVNACYIDDSFYVITYALSNKIRQIERNPSVAVCGEWFSGHGVAENMGYLLDAENKAIFARLRSAFAEWYENGHIDESDPNTCILRIRLTDGVLYSNGTRCELDFTAV